MRFSYPGGRCSNDLLVRRTPKTHDWALLAQRGLSYFTRIYDGDIIKGSSFSAGSVKEQWDWEAKLCSQPYMPCSLIMGEGIIHRHNGRITCDSNDGCTGILLLHVTVQCDPSVVSTSAVFEVVGQGSTVRILNSTISDCSSSEDGGSVLAYGGSSVEVSNSTFLRSFSQVLFLT